MNRFSLGVTPAVGLSDTFKSVKQLRSFQYAFAGLWVLLKTQRHARIHLIASALVISAGFWLRVSRADWCWLVLAIAGVWTAEAFNTALEFLADAVHPEQHPMVGKAKDAAAGAVLIAALASVLIGALVLGPHVSGR